MGFDAPNIDYHAFAPEIVLTATLVLVLLLDLVAEERARWATSSVAGIGLLASVVPVITLAVDGGERVLFGGAYVVDDFALVLKALFLLAGYVTILISTDYIADGDYYEGEYYFMLLSSLLGMTVMASSRDLLSIFVALELLSIPAYLLAGWRKRDLRGNEASLKYYLLGVFATAVMLYGMSLVFGVAGTTLLTGIGDELARDSNDIPLVAVGIVFIVVGFGFKVSAVPFHTWAPDTYEGAPTPITAFLSVASKTAGFVALLQLVFVGFLGREDVWGPMFWVLAALTMTVGNLVALRQTNLVRLLAYSSVAQAGYMLVPFAVAGDLDAGPGTALEAVVAYLLIYAAMNLGAFAVVMAVARKTRSGEIASYGGLFEYAPGLAVLMSIFLFALAGIPP
ncbi:MAG: NADH-quinone oxidoreductase subunit N, partial [Acidimicrobiia bacterium]|nr:NADH-quinone oxidoreductase subunit N [Acidimicrobiia bacterium]